MLRVGLTGNIGSGKSLVASIFDTLGISVFNADQEARKLFQEEEVKIRLRKIFGDGILTPAGEIDRKAIAAIVFNDPVKLEELNRFIHPLVRQAYIKWNDTKTDQPYTIYEAAILIESSYYKELDKLILVTAPEEVRIQRVVSRDGVTRQDVMMRMSNQWEESKKVPLADFVVYNDGITMVIPQVMEIHNRLMKGTGG